MIELLENLVNENLKKIGYDEHVHVIVSNRPELCDYQCDGIFILAKKYHKSPIEIGEALEKEMNLMEDFSKYFKKIEFVKPGFLNITLSDELICKFLIDMMEKPKFGIKEEKEETYFLDYGGYNVAKPLHIGHLRPTIIGEAIKRIIAYKGHKTISDVHLGDYGLQMGEVIYGIERDGLKKEDITIEYLNHIYPEISALCKENEEVKEKCAFITKKLQEKDVYYNKLLDTIISVSVEDAKSICDYLDVSFDLWQGERDSYAYLNEVEEILNEKHLLEESEGALIVNVKREDENKPMPPMMFKKSNGAYLYDSTDLATIYERKQKYHPDHVIYVTDFRQNLHFEQVFRVSDKADFIPYNSLEHAYNGTINGKDGKPFKTREGSAPKLSELFSIVRNTFISQKEENKNMDKKDVDKIVNAIIKFADLQNSRDKDYIFDVDKFSSVVGKTGPYILYTYLRINKIIEKEETLDLNQIIYNEVDRNLRIEMLKLEVAIEKAFKERKPHYIADYIYNLCVCANSFYQKNHIITEEDKEKRASFVYILTLTNKILKEMLSLIMIDIPKIM